MATKYGRMVTNLERLTHNITLPFGHMVLQDHLTNWKRCISTTTLLMASKLDRMVTNLERLIPKILLYLLLTWSCEIMWQIKNIVSTTVPMPTKLDKMVTNLEGLLPVLLLHPLVMWSCKIAWQTKIILSQLLQGLWSPSLSGWWLIIRGSNPCYYTLWLHCLARSLHYHDPCDHQTWQECGLPWWGPTHKVIWPLNHVVLQDHVTTKTIVSPLL